MPLKGIPFPVDIERFKPDNSEKEFDCFVYFKNRSKQDLNLIEMHDIDRSPKHSDQETWDASFNCG
jgi:hypothetical protein